LHLVDKLPSKKYAETINIVCAGNRVFVKYQAQEGGLTPTPHLAYALGCYNAVATSSQAVKNAVNLALRAISLFTLNQLI